VTAHVDAGNPVVELCTAGMAAEGGGRRADAKALFEQAWHASGNDYEAAIAAHYVARHQPTPEATLEWNERSLRRAEAARDANDARVNGFFPSLYLNYAHSLEELGRVADACSFYNLAAASLEALPADGYAALVRTGVTAGQRRTCDEART
jgi:hypothetical protein